MSKIEVNTVAPQCGTTLTLGESGDTVTLGCGASQTGFGRTGTVDWVTTVQTSTPFTATSGKGYFINTTSGAITMNLPTSPTAGDIVAVSDYAKTFDDNNLTIGRGGSNIGGVGVDAIVNTEGIALTLVYIDGTKGWIITDSGNQSNASTAQYVAATGGSPCSGAICGDYKTHTFTGPGTLTVSCGGNACGSDGVEYIIVAGGGGGGNSGCRGGGGGAGGFRFSSPSLAPATYPAKPLAAPAVSPVTATPYPIVVGGGGAIGTVGDVSSFNSLTAAGGGFGGSNSPDNRGPDGSGGGGSGPGGGSPVFAGGTGNDPPVSPAQGKDGGPGEASPPGFGGGGGGALACGTTGSSSPEPEGAPGGVGGGFPNAFGTSGQSSGGFYYFSGGGGGGYYGDAVPGGQGGLGGGGDGQGYDGVVVTAGSAGTCNTGGGGGGMGLSQPAPDSTGYAGGSGIVIIRYKFQ